MDRATYPLPLKGTSCSASESADKSLEANKARSPSSAPFGPRTIHVLNSSFQLLLLLLHFLRGSFGRFHSQPKRIYPHGLQLSFKVRHDARSPAVSLNTTGRVQKKYSSGLAVSLPPKKSRSSRGARKCVTETFDPTQNPIYVGASGRPEKRENAPMGPRKTLLLHGREADTNSPRASGAPETLADAH